MSGTGSERAGDGAARGGGGRSGAGGDVRRFAAVAREASWSTIDVGAVSGAAGRWAGGRSSGAMRARVAGAGWTTAVLASPFFQLAVLPEGRLPLTDGDQ